MPASNCERPLLGLNQLKCGTDRLRAPLQDGDHSGNDPQLVPGFLHPCSEMFPERLRSASISVGSREIRLTLTEHSKCETLSCWILGTVFLLTLTSISWETCVIHSSLILGTDVFRDWLFLGSSSCVFFCNGCQLSFVSQNYHPLGETMLNSTKYWIIFVPLTILKVQ